MTDADNGRLWLTDDTWGVTLNRTYALPVDALWDWVTNPDRLTGWYCPISGNLTPGGQYQMHFGDETGSGVIQR